MQYWPFILAGWLAFGAVCGWWAGRSWRRRWGQDDKPPAGIFASAVFGPAAIGFVLAEMSINSERGL